MNLLKHTAFVTLLAFFPAALGCSTGAIDETEAPAAPSATRGAALVVAGATGESRRAFTEEEVSGVVGNTLPFRVDGATTTDFSRVLTAARVDVDAGNGKTATLLRNGNRLELQGSPAGVAVEIDGARFTIVSDAGRWECLLSGLDADAQAKVAGAMTLGVLLALDEDLAARAVEEGRCEIACATVIAFAIVVGVGVLAALTAFVVCETTGQARCERLARDRCRSGVRSVTKRCDAIAAAEGIFKNGRLEFRGGCRIECR